MPISTTMAKSQPSPTTAPLAIPKAAPRRVFRAFRGRRKPTTTAAIDNNLDHSTSTVHVSTTQLRLEILEESLSRPPPHA